MKKIISKVISKLKNENYELDKNISLLDLMNICFEKFLMVIRGFYHRFLCKKSSSLLFVGKKVKIRCHRKIKFKGVATINDYCYINALSNNGITIGKNFTLGRNSIIECYGVIRNIGEELVIGDNVGISANAFIGVRGKINIGSDTIIGPNFNIHSENHIFNDTKK